MQSVQIYEIPSCRMVASGVGMFGDGPLEAFDEWFSQFPRSIYPKDFLFWDDSDPEKSGFRWLYLYEEGMTVPDAFSLTDFPGGLYAVATDIDQQTDMDDMNHAVDAFLTETGFVRDADRPSLGNVITSPQAQEILGYVQMNYWFPIRKK